MPKTSSRSLGSWNALNQTLMRTTDEAALRRLLATEQNGANRLTFVKRIYSRLNKVRADRERRELL